MPGKHLGNDAATCVHHSREFRKMLAEPTVACPVSYHALRTRIIRATSLATTIGYARSAARGPVGQAKQTMDISEEHWKWPHVRNAPASTWMP